MRTTKRWFSLLLLICILCGTVSVIAGDIDINTRVNTAIEATGEYLANTYQNPAYGTINGDWMVMALARGNINVHEDYYSTYYNNVVNTTIEKSGILDANEYSVYSRVILSLSSIGKDPRNVGGYNLLTPLADYGKVTTSLISSVYALLAFDCGNYEIPIDNSVVQQTTRENLIAFILENEKPGGGWTYWGDKADVDMTPMVLQALAPYKDQSNISPYIDRAIVFLSDKQLNDGGFNDYDSFASCESTSQVLTALCALNINIETDPRFIKDGNTILHAIMNYYLDGGGFKLNDSDTVPNSLRTDQAMYSLVAYKRFKSGMSRLYDMTDVIKTPKGYISISFEKFTLGLGFVSEPIKVPFYEGESLATITTRYLGDGNYTNSGSINSNFYLLSVRDTDNSTPVIPQYILNNSTIDASHKFSKNKNDSSWLGQYDYYYMSGWLFVYNNSFPSYGMSDCYPNDGGVIRFQFSLSGYGSDLGIGYDSNGNIDYSYSWFKSANKDLLLKAIADINSNSNKETLLSYTNLKSAYDNAVSILTNIQSSQDAVDKALLKLNSAKENLNNNPAEKKCIITYFSNGAGGTLPIDNNEYTPNSSANIKSAASLISPEGKVFNNWNTKSDGSGTKYFENSTITILDSNINLYAIWSEPTSSTPPGGGGGGGGGGSYSDKTDKFNIDEIIKTNVSYLLKSVTNPSVQPSGGEWSVIALAMQKEDVPQTFFDKYLKNAIEHIKLNKGVLSNTKITEYSRVVLALTSIGKDPSNIGGYNLLEYFSDINKLKQQGINGPLWALISLDSHNYEIPELKDENGGQATRELLIDYIISREKPNGGFGLGNDDVPDVDITSMVLQALSNYKNNDKVNDCINRALSVLSEIQQKNGGFYNKNNEYCLESNAQVLVALTSLGINPETDSRFIKNGKTVISAIMEFSIADGGFKHVLDMGSDIMASEQALYSLIALQKFKNNEGSLYNMSDIKLQPITENILPESQEIEIVDIFSDLVTHWAKNEIYRLHSKQIVNGVSNDLFEPDRNMTRAEFAAIAVKALSLDRLPNEKFIDVTPDDWFDGFVGSAEKNGLISGISDTIFDPLSNITREEAAVILTRAAKFLNAGKTVDDSEIIDLLAGFEDYIDSSNWSMHSLATSVKNGIISQQNIRLRPLDNITRAEAAVMIYRLLLLKTE